jgi:hypothetical protein
MKPSCFALSLTLLLPLEALKQEKAAVVVMEGGGFIVELVQLDDAVPLESIST